MLNPNVARMTSERTHRGEGTAEARTQAGVGAEAQVVGRRRRRRRRVERNNGGEEAIGGQDRDRDRDHPDDTMIIPADPDPGATDDGPPELEMTRNGAAARKRRRRRSDLPTMILIGTIRSDTSRADQEPWWPIGTASSKMSAWGPSGGWWSASMLIPVPRIGSPSRSSATSSATPTAPSSRPTSSRTSTAAAERANRISLACSTASLCRWAITAWYSNASGRVCTTSSRATTTVPSRCTACGTLLVSSSRRWTSCIP
mmetsp:Transcript_19541/g.46209  ORF Transcript_19541/g.46209 Transcript_19541/m.46209 type:complete len:258 (-) Transcript_19541:636-1409(-)